MSVRVPRRSDTCVEAWAADPHGKHADPDHRYMAVEAFAAGWNAAISAYFAESDEENYSGAIKGAREPLEEWLSYCIREGASAEEWLAGLNAKAAGGEQWLND